MKDKLTKNQQQVLAVLQNAKGPLTAYAILDRLHDKGFRAPLQVYRALEKLVALHYVHRLKTVNAYLFCNHKRHREDCALMFAICEGCGKVEEIEDSALGGCLSRIGEKIQFQAHYTSVEVKGVCKFCTKE